MLWRTMAQPPSTTSPEMVAQFIEETLVELADLASRKGYRALAGTLMIAALEAARAAAGAPDESH